MGVVVGGTPDAVTTAATAETLAPDSSATVRFLLAVPRQTVRLWDAQTGGSQYTTLRDLTGAALPTPIVTDDYGQMPFVQLPDSARVNGVWVDPDDTSTARFWLPARFGPADADRVAPDPTGKPDGYVLTVTAEQSSYRAVPGTGTSQVSIADIGGGGPTARTWWRGALSKIRSSTLARSAADFITWGDGRASVGDGTTKDDKLPYLLQGEDFTPESGIVAGIGSLSKALAMWVTDAAEVGFYKVILPLKSVARTNLADEVTDLLPGQWSAESGIVWAPASPTSAVALYLRDTGQLVAHALAVGAGGLTVNGVAVGGTGGTSGTGAVAPGVASATGTAPNRLVEYSAIPSGKRTVITTTGGAGAPDVTPDGRVTYFEGANPSLLLVTTPGSGIVANATSLLTDWAALGDSHTDGVGSGGSTGNRPDAFVTKLAGMLGYPVANYGYAGQTTRQINARQGSERSTVTAAFTIPADTSPVAVVLGGDPMWSDGLPRTEVAIIGGVSGTLTCTQSATPYVGSYTFARTTAGAATPVAVGAPVLFQCEVDSRSRTQIWWGGRNNLRFNQGFQSIYDGAANFWNDRDGGQRSVVKRKLIIGMTSKTTETPSDLAGIMAYNAFGVATYGRNFVDLDAYLRSPQALVDAGLTATTDDLADIAAGLIPRQLHSGDGSGGTHFTAPAHLLIATQLFNRAVELTWRP